MAGVNGDVPTLVPLQLFERLRPQFRREVDQIVWHVEVRCARTAAGLDGNGCVGDVFSPGTSDCGTGVPTIGQTGWPVTRSKHVELACLLGDATALIARPSTLMSMRIGADELSKFQIG